MINPLSEQLRKHNGSEYLDYKDCYDDHKDREVLECWLKHGEDYNDGADEFRRFVAKEFNLSLFILF